MGWFREGSQHECQLRSERAVVPEIEGSSPRQGRIVDIGEMRCHERDRPTASGGAAVHPRGADDRGIDTLVGSHGYRADDPGGPGRSPCEGEPGGARRQPASGGGAGRCCGSLGCDRVTDTNRAGTEGSRSVSHEIVVAGRAEYAPPGIVAEEHLHVPTQAVG